MIAAKLRMIPSTRFFVRLGPGRRVRGSQLSSLISGLASTPQARHQSVNLRSVHNYPCHMQGFTLNLASPSATHEHEAQASQLAIRKKKKNELNFPLGGAWRGGPQVEPSEGLESGSGAEGRPSGRAPAELCCVS